MSAGASQNFAASSGGNGGILSSPRHVRREARDIVRMLRFGKVFTEEQVMEMIQAAHPLAIECAERANPRGYAACMRVLTGFAKLEQAEEPQRHEHEHNYSVDDRRSKLAELARSLGASQFELDGEIIDVHSEVHDDCSTEGTSDPVSPSSDDHGEPMAEPAPPSTLGLAAGEGGE